MGLSIRMRFVVVGVSLATLAYGCGILFSRLPLRESNLGQHVAWLFVAGMSCIAIGALTGYMLAQPIRRRLYDIEEAAALIAGGRLHHRIAGVGGSDEIDQLAHQFNTMGERIEAQVVLLQQLAEENHRLAQTAERAATLEERGRVSRELHDSVSQQLFSMTMLSAAAKEACEVKTGPLPEMLNYLEELANQAQREMRALLLHLRPIDLAGKPFTEAVEGFLQAVADRHGLQVQFRDDTVEPRTGVVEEQLFRILQEAVANVLKHAQAAKVTVALVEGPAYVELTISDDGCGLTVNAGEVASDTYGMTAMRERALRLGGQLDVLSRERGTTIRVVIPRSQETTEETR